MFLLILLHISEKFIQCFGSFFVCDLSLKHLARRGEEESKEGAQKGLMSISLETVEQFHSNHLSHVSIG